MFRYIVYNELWIDTIFCPSSYGIWFVVKDNVIVSPQHYSHISNKYDVLGLTNISVMSEMRGNDWRMHWFNCISNITLFSKGIKFYVIMYMIHTHLRIRLMVLQCRWQWYVKLNIHNVHRWCHRFRTDWMEKNICSLNILCSLWADTIMCSAKRCQLSVVNGIHLICFRWDIFAMRRGKLPIFNQKCRVETVAKASYCLDMRQWIKIK